LAAIKIGATGFVVPFMFVYGPSLLLIGSWSTIVTTIISASIGVLALSAGLMGWFVKKVETWERIVLLAAAVLLIKPGLYTDAIGYILLLLVFLKQKYWRSS
jgi:TRAP-type uncharacterized transport system fused permease subunit